MTGADIEGVIVAQSALIAALDAGDVGTIETATAALSQLLTAVRKNGAMVEVSRDRVEHAVRQTEAARTRVNYLADRTRQRLDRLAERRGLRRSATYNATGNLAVFRG